MPNQHRNGSLSEVLARATPAARFARASAPLLATLMFVVASGAVHYAPVLDEVVDQADANANGFGAEANEPFVAAAPLRQGPRLSVEQQNVARFIARRYRLAMDQTQELVEQAYKIAREAKLDPWLVLAVISVESSFNPQAQSSKGAQGLMQVLTRVHADKFAPFGGASAAFDPLANMRVGTQILKEYLVRAEGSVERALKYYVGAALLPHDGGYGAKVLFERERIAAAAAGRAQPVRPPVTVAQEQPQGVAEAPAPAGVRETVALAGGRDQEAAAMAAPRSADIAFRPWVELDRTLAREDQATTPPDQTRSIDKPQSRDI